MTSRKRPAPEPIPPASTHIVNTWKSHPVATLGTIATLVAVLSGIAPLLIWALHYYATHEELETHKSTEARVTAWGTVQSLKTEQLVLRNRVNDCEIRKETPGKVSALERQACAQYQQEFDDASRRFIEARKVATEMSKEK